MFFRRREGDSSTEESGRLRIPLLVGAAMLGVLLLIFGGRSQRSTDDANAEKVPISATEEMEAYLLETEERVKQLCLSVKGVESVTVAVTLGGGFEEVYATEQIDGNEEYVIVGSGSNASALYVTRLPPEIVGIGVVCRGGGSADVRRELLALLSAAFRVPANRIYITEAKY